MRQRLWLTAAVVCVAVAATNVHAQTEAGDTGTRIAQIKDRISAAKARDDIDAAVRERAVNTYQQAISALESAQSDQHRADQFRDSSRDAPGEIRQLKAQLNALEAPASAADLDALSAAALSRRADAIGARLADTQARLTDLRDQLTRIAQRPEAARQELADARNTLQGLAAGVSGAGQQSVVTEAERALLSARRQAMSAKIERLQQELSSVDSRERLLEARRTLAEAKLARDNASLSAVQRALTQQQTKTARALRKQAGDKLSELRAAVGPVSDAAQRNVELARRLTDVAAQSDALAQRQSRQRKRVEEIQRRLNLVQRQLEIGGRSVALGDVLRTQQRDMANPAFADASTEVEEAPDIASAELRRFQLQQARAELDDLPAKATSLAHMARVRLDAGQRQSLISLLDKRREILDMLIDAEGRFIDIGRDLRALGAQYDDTQDAFNRLLDERLFWLPSFGGVHLDWFGQVAADLPWAFAPAGWRDAAIALVRGAGRLWILATIAALLLAVLTAARRLLRKRLRRLGEPVGNVRRDTFWLTLRATLVTALLGAPGVVLLLVAGFLMREAVDASEFSRAVAAGVIQLGVLTLFIEPFVQVCRKNGLAENHFHWDRDARHGLHRMLRWLLAMLVVPTLFITLAEFFDDDSKRQTIGRAAFMFSSLVIAGFSWRLLHPVRGVLADVLGPTDDSHWRLGYLWLPLAVGVPLLLCGLAGWGYYYTALQLQTRFFYSAGLLGGSIILYSLIVRWVTVAERRLALTRALRKREEAREARASREAAAAAGEGAPENLDTLEIDLVQISEQTRGLIQVVIALLVGTGLWLIWSDTLPALQLLDKITLWQYATEVEGGRTQLTNVTLGALLLALVVGVITFLAGRNLPGFLEITVLRRFSLNSGSRYATATLFQYAIVTAGLLVAVSLIGLRWSSIQWLVAALGVGLGFGLQEIFANFVSGIVILFERPVRVGDTVTVGALTGTVSRIRIRATTITDWDNKEVVIPNRTFITETVINWTLTDDITRLIIRVHLALDTDTDLAERLITDAIGAEPVALEDPAPSVFMVGYDDSTLIYEARVFYHDLYNLLPLQHALYKRIHAAFAEHDVVVSFPQRDLHLRSMDRSFERFGAAAAAHAGDANGDSVPEGG